VKLEVFETKEAKELISILESCKKNAHLSEQIKKKIVDEDFSRLSDTFEIVKTRKTLAEILAEKIQPK
jgi:hypothetical protein